MIRTLTVQDGIVRLKKHCKENNYRIITKDPEAKELQDNVLQHLHDINAIELDSYTIYSTYNHSEFIVYQGSLIEMFYDMDLLQSFEILETGQLEFMGEIQMRRNAVRQPWDRRT